MSDAYTEPQTNTEWVFLRDYPTQAEIRQRVEDEARRLGETDVRAILKAVDDESPVGRFILKLLELPVRNTARPGRPEDQERTAIITGVVEGLRRSGHSAAEAHSLAPKLLMRRGIYKPGPRKLPISQKAVREACRNWISKWFEPIPD